MMSYGLVNFRHLCETLNWHWEKRGKDIDKVWNFPNKTKLVTLEEAIGKFPSLDPFISERDLNERNFFYEFEKKIEDGLKFSEFHYPVSHPISQIISMQNTPSGKSAFENPNKFKPKNK